MTRFHVVAMLTALAIGVALLWHNVALLVLVIGLFLIVVGFGVAVPRMRLFGPFICRGSNAQRWVALTFDDGPDPRSTPQLLDLLQKENVSAAFFCVGERVSAHPELAVRIVGEGHLLGNHSHRHRNSTNIFGLSRLRSELECAQAAIEKAAGVAPKLFRPPMGLSNPRVFHVARDLGLTVVGWSARGLDTQCQDPERVVARIARRLKPGGIILLHDGNIPVDRLLLTVKLLLARLRKNSYEIVPLNRLLQ